MENTAFNAMRRSFGKRIKMSDFQLRVHDWFTLIHHQNYADRISLLIAWTEPKFAWTILEMLFNFFHIMFFSPFFQQR